jgi:hypothetical protein
MGPHIIDVWPNDSAIKEESQQMMADDGQGKFPNRDLRLDNENTLVLPWEYRKGTGAP